MANKPMTHDEIKKWEKEFIEEFNARQEAEASQREWQGLTDEERGKIFDVYGYGYQRVDVVAMARAIEQALKEKNSD